MDPINPRYTDPNSGIIVPKEPDPNSGIIVPKEPDPNSGILVPKEPEDSSLAASESTKKAPDGRGLFDIVSNQRSKKETAKRNQDMTTSSLVEKELDTSLDTSLIDKILNTEPSFKDLETSLQRIRNEIEETMNNKFLTLEEKYTILLYKQKEVDQIDYQFRSIVNKLTMEESKSLSLDILALKRTLALYKADIENSLGWR